MKCIYCGRDGFKNNHSLSAHRQFNIECHEKWKREQDIIELSKTQSKVKCAICGVFFKNISNTHLKKHDCTMKQYKIQYPNSPLFSNELLKIQRDKREHTIHTKYTDAEIKYFKGIKSRDAIIKIHGKNAGQIAADDRIQNPEKWKKIDRESGRSTKLFYKNLKEDVVRYKNHLDHRIQSLKETNQQLYGVDFIVQTKYQKEKSKATCLERYGVESITQTDIMKEKSKATCLKKYGYTSSNQSKAVKEKKKQACLNHFGVTHWAKSDEGRLFHRITAIKYAEKQLSNGEPIMPRVGNKERPCLNELQKHTEYKILRQDPRFRYVIGRIPDGYILELKFFILFDEFNHFEDKKCTILNEDSILETKNYKSLNDCILFRISEKEWLDNQKLVIERFKKLL